MYPSPPGPPMPYHHHQLLGFSHFSSTCKTHATAPIALGCFELFSFSNKIIMKNLEVGQKIFRAPKIRHCLSHELGLTAHAKKFKCRQTQTQT